MCIRDSFTDWLLNTRPTGSGGGGWRHQKWRQFGTWSAENWCKTGDGENLIDHLIPTQNLTQILPKLIKLRGIPVENEVPYKNSRRPVGTTQWYTDTASNFIFRNYAWDISYLKQSLGNELDRLKTV